MLYKKVLDKFILQYLGIPGLSSLYNEHYMDFEWNMHSNLNFENHTNSYYRDHFIHEIRNLFMMFCFFDDHYIYDNVEKALFSPKFSKISEYATHQLNVWSKNIPESQKILFSDSHDSNYESKKSEDYFKRYVIFASTILACLFHDIGYPVSYYFSIKDRILDFIPSFHALISDSNFDFNYVNSVLEESILFQVVGKEEIKKRFDENDHGAISAILIGIYFYKTGKIHSLPIEQKTAIEIGTLAIYNHTLKFAYCDEKNAKKTDYYKMQFPLNPISYMLRLCDDSQEWDREYFEIKSISNLLFCPECLTPLRRISIGYQDYLDDNNIPIVATEEDDLSVKCYRYWCACHKHFTKKDDFTRRKLVNIKACNEVTVSLNDTALNNYIEINFKYDNFKLLRLCTLQLSFTEYRFKEMEKLKKFVEKQSFLDGKKGYRGIFIKHNLTPNPMLLKMFILRDFLTQVKSDKISPNKELKNHSSISNRYLNVEDIYQRIIQYGPSLIIENKSALDELEVLARRIVDLFYEPSEILDSSERDVDSGVMESVESKSSTNNSKKLQYSIIAQNCKYYLFLLLYEHYVITSVDKDEVKSYLNWIIQEVSLSKDDLRYEIYVDAINQIKVTYKPHNFNQIGTDEYCSYLKATPKNYLDIQYYCDEYNILNQEDKVETTTLSYYTDLYLYNKLNEITTLVSKKIIN